MGARASKENAAKDKEVNDYLASMAVGIDKQRIINRGDYEGMVEELTCGICSQFAIKPVRERNECGIIFCKNCIQSFWAQNGMRACPFACIYPEFVQMRIERALVISCKNLVHGCDEVLYVEDFALHEINCPFERIKCRSNNCNVMLPKKNIEVHETTCIFIKQECSRCKQNVAPDVTHDCTQLLLTLLQEKSKKLTNVESNAKKIQEEIKKLEEEAAIAKVALEQKTREAQDQSDKARESLRAVEKLIESIDNNSQDNNKIQNPFIDANQERMPEGEKREKHQKHRDLVEEVAQKMSEKKKRVKNGQPGKDREKDYVVNQKEEEEKGEDSHNKALHNRDQSKSRKLSKKDGDDALRGPSKTADIDKLIKSFFNGESRLDISQDYSNETEEEKNAQNLEKEYALRIPVNKNKLIK